MQLGDELQFWTERDGTPLHFKAMGALHSEMAAISTAGQLCQWRWADAEPFVSSAGHPKDLQVSVSIRHLLHRPLSYCKGNEKLELLVELQGCDSIPKLFGGTPRTPSAQFLELP